VKLTARVPATSANLGPGFDCFGLALDLWNEVTVDTEAPAGVAWDGEGAGELPTDGSDMVSRAMAHAAAACGVPLVPVALQGLNRIPLERGLGSSASACVAGIALADRLLQLDLDRDEVLDLAIEIEGHPDNAAAAIVGGFTLAFGDGVLRLDVAPGVRPVALIPTDIRLPTAEARAALHDVVPREAAVYNLSHAAAAVVALTSQPELLGATLTDRLHQDVRLAFVPSVRKVFDDLRGLGVPVCVSGAGPTLLAFEFPDRAVPDPGEGWRRLPLAVASTGVEVTGS